MDTVSVIIPVYNTAKYLEQSLYSIVNQTYNDLEIIIIDDGSTDHSVEIINNFVNNDKRIKFIQHEKRKGVGVARNLGIKNASGKYVYFFDSDDYLPPKTIALLVDNIKEYDLIRGKVKSTQLNSSFAVIFEGHFLPKIYNEDKYNLIKNNSACNFLIKKEFIHKNNLSFSEENLIYSDLYFMIPAISQMEFVPYLAEAIYFKRKRSNPVHNPSLSQLDIEKKINDFLKCFIDLKLAYKSKKIDEFLDSQFLNFYRKNIVKYFYNEKNIDYIYDDLYEAATKIHIDNLKNYDFIINREIKTLVNRNKNRYIRLIRRFNLLRDVKQGLVSKDEFFHFIYKRVFSKMSINNNLVLFESFQGRSYSDNPKYIYEYMLRNKKEYKFVWALNEKKSIIGNPIIVKRLSLRYYYYLAKSKYWVSNSRMRNKLFKREGTVYLQTWHGTPLKKLASDMDNVFMPGTNILKYKENFYEETSKWDYLVSANKYSTEIFKRAFWFDKQMLEFGYPRNDILYNQNNKSDIDKIKDKLNIPKNKKIIMYAPTWRDDEFYEKGSYKFSLKLDLNKLKNQLGDEWIIILRMHYLISSNLDISSFKGFAVDLSNYNDISELYLISDILITDYSSVFFDYANLKRPMLFYMYDIEKYRDQLRGFYLDLNELPGPILINTDEVLDSIINITNINMEYKQKYQKFYDKFCHLDDGNASENVVTTIFN